MRRLVIGIVAIVVVLAIIAGQSGTKTATAIPARSQAATATLAASSTPANAAATTSVGSPVSGVQASVTLTSGIATPTPKPSQVVTVKEDAVNLRQSADVAAAVVTLVPPGTDATVIGEDTTGPDGVTRYVHARVGSNEGYLRSDLVSAPHVVTPAPPTAVPTATAIAPTAIPDYDADYPVIDPADLSKRPDYYKGKRFSVIGKAFNVHESNGVTTFQMQAEVSEYNTVAVVLTFNGTSSGLQDNVRLRAYCVGAGAVSGTNAFGGNVTEPAMLAVRIGPPSDASNAAMATSDAGNHLATGTAIIVNTKNVLATATALSKETDNVIATSHAVNAASDALNKSTYATLTAVAKKP